MTLVVSPRISEKAYAQADKLNVYVFDVPTEMNKLQVKQIVESDYQVSVMKVRILKQTGKKARSIRLKQRGRYQVGSRSDYKKAYVTLIAGDEIPVFADATNQEGDN